MGTRPDLAGYRIKEQGQPPVYLVDDDGTRRWIPNPLTYNNLFRDWDGIVQDLDINEIDRGPDITDGAILGKAPHAAPIYLISNDVKRWVTSPAVMDKFHFSWDAVQQVAESVLEALPSGSDLV
jgi:hypothetical protein